MYLLVAAVNCICAQGDNTCLHWAAMRGHVEIVKLLLEVRRCAP